MPSLLSNRTITRFIEQSNAIEGIDRLPTSDDFGEHRSASGYLHTRGLIG